MKKLIFLMMMFIFFISCSSNEQKYKVKSTNNKYDLSILGETKIEGCDYFIVRTYVHNIMIHKGNCTNPIHYRNNSFDSLKYVQKIQQDSMKILLLERKIEVLEKMNDDLMRKR